MLVLCFRVVIRIRKWRHVITDRRRIGGTAATKFVGYVQPISCQLPFSLGIHLICSLFQPVTLSTSNEKVCCFLRKLNSVLDTRAFHSSSCIHGISKELSSGKKSD